MIKTSKNQLKIQARDQKKQESTPRRYKISNQLVSNLEKMVKNGINSIKFISFERISQLCEQQLVRISKFKDQESRNAEQVLDNELTVSVVGMQSKIILEERRQIDFNASRLSLPDKRREGQEFKQYRVIKRFQDLVGEIQKSQNEIQIFIDREVNEDKLDFAKCYFFFLGHLRKLKKISKQKLISSRIKLLQTIIYFLREAASKLQPQMIQRIEVYRSQQSIVYGANASFLESPRSDPQQEILSYEQINNWPRYSSRFVEDKIIELSGICQQIPQLETYKRTLQFAQLQSSQKVSFFKVVDVLISLHHKVSYLSRNKPQLLKDLQQAKSQIIFINMRIDEFLSHMMNETNQIYPINFEGLDQRCKTQLTQELNYLKGYLHKLSEIVIRQDQIHTQNYAKVDRLIRIVEIFGKVLLGQQQFVEQWEELVNQQQRKDSQTISNEEYRVVMILQQCLALQQSRIEHIQQAQNTQVNRTNEELEIEVNKLIEDYERLKVDNNQLMNTLQMERRLREQLLVEVDQRDKIIKNLSAKKLTLQKKLNKNDGESVASSKIKDGQFRKLQHEAQKYLESSLLLKQQLKVSEAEREKLAEQMQSEKQKYSKAFQSLNRLKPQKERLQIQCEELQSRIQALRNEQLRQSNRLNKIITDLTNDKSLLEMQLDTAQRNNLRLMERLDLNDKKLAQYNKLMMARLDEKDDNSLIRLERQVQKYKKEAQGYQKDSKQLESQNKGLREELSNLKYRLKQNQLNREDQTQSEQAIMQMKAKVQKLQLKNNNLTRSLDESKSKQQQLEEKLKVSTKKIKQLQNRQKDFEIDRARLTKIHQQAERRSQDLQRQLDDLRHWNEKQARTAREMISKKQLQLLEKMTSLSSLELKIRMLEEQLSQKSNQSDKVTQQLIQTKVKQFETTIQTHKLIQLKLQQKAKGLQKELQEKIEIQFKLGNQIDRLIKQIDRMKAQLQNYLRELTQKQLIIKIERQKMDEQVKQIRQYQIKEKLREQQINTPHRDKPSREQQNATTPSLFQDLLSRSNLRYDNYFNAKEYDRLSKQYSDFKKHASQKLQALQSSLEQALKDKAKLKAQLSMSSSKQKEIYQKSQFSKQKVEQLLLQIKLQMQKNDNLQDKINQLTKQNQNFTLQLKKSEQRLSQQSQLLEGTKKQKAEINDKLLQQLLDKEKNKLINTKQKQFAEKVSNLEIQIRSLQQKNKNLNEAYEKLQKDMERQTKNMFNHYETQMKRVITETDEVNSKLASEVDFLKQQIQIQQNPFKLQRQKEQTLNQLKLSIQQLLAQKSKFQSQNARLQSQKAMSDDQRLQSIKKLTQLKEKNVYQNLLIKNLQEKAKLSIPFDENVKIINDCNLQINNLLKQRDFIRSQHDSMKRHLQQDTKRAIYLQSQLNNLKSELQSERRRNFQLQGQIKTQNDNIKISLSDQKIKNFNEEYLHAKIRALEQALQAVGQELTDCKALKNKQVFQCNKMVKSQIINHPIESVEFQRLTLLQNDWMKKEKVYLEQLQSMSREIYNLRQVIKSGKNERPIITSLPQGGIPANNTYPEGGFINKIELIRVQKILQGKKRWQNMQFSQSLSKWGVPSLVCQQIEDLRNLFLGTSKIIGAINQQQINLQQMLESLPSLENLMQYVLRILSFFSEVDINSPQALKIRSQLQNITKKYTGGYFFTVLEQYTIHILQNNAIQEYKRQLRAKARELLLIKQKLDDLITQQLEQQQRIYNRPKPTAGRSLEPGLYPSSSYSSLSSSRNK